MVKVGIPRCLMCSLFYPMWKAFFEGLGAEVVLSGPTNRRILDEGVGACVDEACLAVKVCFGHAKSLMGKADFLFVPRLTSLHAKEYVCPKLGGLPDMLRNGVPGLPPVIAPEINLRDKRHGLLCAAMEIGSVLRAAPERIRSSYERALRTGQDYSRLLLAGADPSALLDGKPAVFRPRTRPCAAVIGHCYNLYDDYISMNLLGKLSGAGIGIRTIETTDAAQIDRKASGIPKRMFWYFGRKAVGAALSMLERGEIDGMLYVMAFGCGIDSFVCDYVERLVRSRSDIPFSVLTIDEHTGEAGLDTRLEAFTDMIRWRSSHEADLSAYGKRLHLGQDAFG